MYVDAEDLRSLTITSGSGYTYNIKSLAPQTYLHSIATFERVKLLQFILSLIQRSRASIEKRTVNWIAHRVRVFATVVCLAISNNIVPKLLKAFSTQRHSTFSLDQGKDGPGWRVHTVDVYNLLARHVEWLGRELSKRVKVARWDEWCTDAKGQRERASAAGIDWGVDNTRQKVMFVLRSK
jgi:hypothetical protein